MDEQTQLADYGGSGDTEIGVASDSYSIPQQLRERPQRVTFRYEVHDGKPRKVQYNPRTGRRAKVNDPTTWTSFDTALSAHQGKRFDGLGYVFTAEDPFTGIDIDGCRDPETGGLTPDAQRIIESIPGYWEPSVSGRGVHGIVIAKKPGTRCRSGMIPGVEMYDWGRFFTMTGTPLDGHREIRESQNGVDALYGDLFPPTATVPSTAFPRTPTDASDQVIIDKAMAAANGKKFRRLWNGDISGYPSHSEADLALCSMLVFWAGCDPERIDRLVRQSGLYRDKWDSLRGEHTYGQQTIELAVALCEETYDWNRVNGTNRSSLSSNGTEPKPEDQHDEDTQVSTTNDEIGTTKRLADAIQADDSFAQDAGGRLYRFHNGVYKPDGERYINRRVKALLEDWGETKSWSSYRAKEVVAYIEVDAPELWERPPIDQINLTNGILDLTTTTLRPHSPDFLSPVQIPAAYNPEAAQDLAWEVAADIVTPERSEQRSILATGEGSNGKSVWLQGLRALVGKENTSSLSLHKLEQDRFATSRLIGKLVNICPDLPSTDLASTATFKAITGGDSLVAEYKYKPSFDFTPFCRLIFSANRPPRSTDDSHAFFRRWSVIPFDHNFKAGENAIPREELDAQLADPGELSGLLNKALAVLPRLREYGFSEPESCRRAWNEFRETTDPFSVWLEQRTIEDADGFIAKRDLRNAYNQDCQETGRARLTDKAVTQALKRTRPDIKDAQRVVDGKTTRVWLGIRFTTSSPGSHRSRDFLNCLFRGDELSGAVGSQSSPISINGRAQPRESSDVQNGGPQLDHCPACHRSYEIEPDDRPGWLRVRCSCHNGAWTYCRTDDPALAALFNPNRVTRRKQ